MELPPATALPSQSPGHQIPDALITDILFRLPLSPCTVRFRCLSKSWCDFLTKPSSIAKTLSSSASPPDHQFLFEWIERTENRSVRFHSWHPSDTPERIQMPFDPAKPRRPDVRFAGCCNGLLCLIQWDGKQDDPILWNPATSETKIVPPSPFERRSDCSSSAIGFGFDPESNDYKIVRPLYIESCCFRSLYFLEIYSLRNDSWTKLDDFPSLSSGNIPQCRMGKLYWWRLSGERTLVFDSFDVGREAFGKVEVPCPNSEKEYNTPVCLLNEESMVAVFPDYNGYEDTDEDDDEFEGRRERRSSSWEIWVMLKYWVPESWTKLYVVTSPVDMTIEYCAGISRNLRFFFAAFSSDLMNEKGYYDGDHGLVTFELETGKFSNVAGIQGTRFEVVTNYVPSQVSLQN
ncbi:unnamed protein product [Linum tenue]|uniref:F-box associated beta-propeller type 1 domain-containing protein n=1 Tax=Linum tenue TaxID=586396 RepID=A0AAV0P823_9ROSI|nr:unnamed protein product [Linum tenue]